MSLVVNDILKFREYVGDSWKNLLIQANMDFNLIYPVGSIYMSTNNTNPATLFGGTWEQLEDRFLLGAGSSYTAGDTGGEATHQLIANELPKISGKVGIRRCNNTYSIFAGDTSGALSTGTETRSGAYTTLGMSGSTTTVDTIKLDFGNDQAHNNMPPYIVVYMWKRLTLAPYLPYSPFPLASPIDICEVETAFSIPASGSSVSYNMDGLTEDYELTKWNFSSSPENKPPVNLTWATYEGYFTITNNSGTTSETIRPMFENPKKVAITTH